MTLSCAAVVQLVHSAMEQLVLLHVQPDLDLPLRNGSSATSVIDKQSNQPGSTSKSTNPTERPLCFVGPRKKDHNGNCKAIRIAKACHGHKF